MVLAHGTDSPYCSAEVRIMRTRADRACWSIITSVIMSMGFPGGSPLKNPPAVQETRVQSLVWEDPLEKGVAPTPVFLPGQSPGQGSLVGYSPWGCKRVGYNSVYD